MPEINSLKRENFIKSDFWRIFGIKKKGLPLREAFQMLRKLIVMLQQKQR